MSSLRSHRLVGFIAVLLVAGVALFGLRRPHHRGRLASAVPPVTSATVAVATSGAGHCSSTAWQEASVKPFLRDIFHSLGGDYWYLRQGWLSARPVDAWYGVSLTQRESECDLTVSLGSNNLTGVLPASLQRFTALYRLQLGSTPRLSGTIPPLRQLSNLRELQLLSGLSLSGTLPSLAGLTNLQDLRIEGLNQLSGSVSDLCSAQLGILHVSNTRISGVLPRLSCAPGLRQLKIDSSPISGVIDTLPVSMQNLHVSDTRISGTLPPLSFSTSYTSDVKVYSNHISGTIPYLGNITSRVYRLLLFNNSFSGDIPPSISQLTYLQQIDLSHNQLQGTMPAFPHTSATIDLSHNRLSGTVNGIPNLSICTQYLVSLNIAHNYFSGTLPECFVQAGQPRLLQTLTLSYNRFDISSFQSLTHILGQSSTLQAVYMSHNLVTYSPSWCLQYFVFNGGANTYTPQLKILDLSSNALGTTLQDALNCYMSKPLTTLVLSNCSLSGVFDSVVPGDGSSLERMLNTRSDDSNMFELTNLDLSDNGISGTMGGLDPTYRYVPEYSSPMDFFPILETLLLRGNPIVLNELPDRLVQTDVSSIDLTVASVLPALRSERLASLTMYGGQLASAALRHELLPLLTQPSAKIQTVFDNVLRMNCPQWYTTLSSNGRVDVNSSFLGFYGCDCLQDHFWNWQRHQCQPCSSTALMCNTSVNDPIFTIARDYYPVFSSSCPLSEGMRCVPWATLRPCLLRGICAVPKSSDGQQPLITGYYCARGYEPHSMLCSACSPGFYRSGYHCHECHGWVAAIAPLFVAGLLVLYHHFLTFKSRSSSSTATLSITILWLQLVRLTSDRSSSALVSGSGSIFQSISDFSPMGMGCVFTFMSTYSLETTLLLPVFLPAVIIGVGTAAKWAHRKWKAAPTNRVFDRHASLFMAFYTWELLYIPVCSAVFVSWTCDSPNDTHSYLTRAPYRGCSESGLRALTAIVFVVYVVLYPVVSVYLIRRPDNDMRGATQALEFLTRASAPEQWFFQPILLRVRAVLLAAVLKTLPWQHPAIPLLVFLILVGSVFYLSRFQPYVTATDNHLSVLTHVALLTIYLNILICQTDYSDQGRMIITDFVYLGTLAACLYILGKSAVKSVRALIAKGGLFQSASSRVGDDDGDGDGDGDAGADYIALEEAEEEEDGVQREPAGAEGSRRRPSL